MRAAAHWPNWALQDRLILGVLSQAHACGLCKNLDCLRNGGRNAAEPLADPPPACGNAPLTALNAHRA